MKTISKEFAKKISGTQTGVYDTKRYRYVNLSEYYWRIPRYFIGTTVALDWRNWERLEVRA